MMKSPAVSAAPPIQSAAASAPPAMPSPTVSAAPAAHSPAPAAQSPRPSTVASQPSSTMCSPRLAPPTTSPPTATAPAVPAATLAPVLQPFFSFLSFSGLAAGAAAAATGGGADGSGPWSSAAPAHASSGGTGTIIAWPAFALAGTETLMNWRLSFGCGTWIVVPGAPTGTFTQVMGPGSMIGAEGGFHLCGGRMLRCLPDAAFSCTRFLKSTIYVWPRRLYLAFGKPDR
mmetsp:Transcript_82455/g.233369  ORF Transcript_82455/g.233369 Transcript_82455/m.233369 type:complete len:230 (+) Transcript_82455:437-1126(+)